MTKNHELTPWKKCNIFDFLSRCFLGLKWLDFYKQGQKTLFSGLFCWKTKKGQKKTIFDQNHGLTSLEKRYIYVQCTNELGKYLSATFSMYHRNEVKGISIQISA